MFVNRIFFRRFSFVASSFSCNPNSSRCGCNFVSFLGQKLKRKIYFSPTPSLAERIEKVQLYVKDFNCTFHAARRWGKWERIVSWINKIQFSELFCNCTGGQTEENRRDFWLSPLSISLPSTHHSPYAILFNWRRCKWLETFPCAGDCEIRERDLLNFEDFSRFSRTWGVK